MVKGISRRVVVVASPDPDLFEQAIFISRNDSAEGVSSQQLVDQAVRIAKSYARTHAAPRPRFRFTPLASALAGAAAIALIWLVMELI